MMTYKEREIARLEGLKDGLIKKLVEECEAINDEIIALRNGTPRKKDSQIYFERGYAKALDDFLNELPDCDYVGIETLVCIGERLKEQKNE